MTANARAVASPRVVNLYDLRSLARRRIPKIVFNYIDGGAERRTHSAGESARLRRDHISASPGGGGCECRFAYTRSRH